jgi:hypothetical protein
VRPVREADLAEQRLRARVAGLLGRLKVLDEEIHLLANGERGGVRHGLHLCLLVVDGGAVEAETCKPDEHGHRQAEDHYDIASAARKPAAALLDKHLVRIHPEGSDSFKNGLLNIVNGALSHNHTRRIAQPSQYYGPRGDRRRLAAACAQPFISEAPEAVIACVFHAWPAAPNLCCGERDRGGGGEQDEDPTAEDAGHHAADDPGL